MDRPPNAWDRFYRYHEAPWRGERPVEGLLPLVGAGPVLELGCGNGKLLHPLRAAGLDVVGLDVSWNVLQRVMGARVLADASYLPFQDGVFSAVLDVHCTGHLDAKGRARANRESHRVLVPGGVVVVERLTPEDLRATQGEAAMDPGSRVLQDGRMTHFSTQEALCGELVAAGFVVDSCEVVRREPVLRGTRVVRESVRVVARRPA